MPDVANCRPTIRIKQVYFSLSGPMDFFFSSMVWKRPWPNLDAVSMNLRAMT